MEYFRFTKVFNNTDIWIVLSEGKELIIRKMLLKNADIGFICEVADTSKEYVLTIQKEIQRNN